MSLIDQRWYQRPPDVPQSLAAGGVVARLTDHQVWIALVRESGFNAYILPKGSVEPGEDLKSAARREIKEEAGLSDLLLLEDLGVLERLNYKRTAWKVTHYFLFLSCSSQAEPTDIHHHYICEWYPINHLPDFFWPEQEALVTANYQRIVDLVTKNDQC